MQRITYTLNSRNLLLAYLKADGAVSQAFYLNTSDRAHVMQPPSDRGIASARLLYNTLLEYKLVLPLLSVIFPTVFI